jgi:5-methyltetrahydrofolate--homocysteine methyltransferase
LSFISSSRFGERGKTTHDRSEFGSETSESLAPLTLAMLRKLGRFHNKHVDSSLLLDSLARQVLIYDGAMGTQLQLAKLGAQDWVLGQSRFRSAEIDAAGAESADRSLEGCNEILTLTRPDIIQGIHENYLAAGADLVETNTFGCTSIVLAEYGLESLVFDLAKQSAIVARAACDKFSATKPRFAVGALGPGTRLISLGQTSWDLIKDTYKLGFIGLLEGGCDALLLETLQDLLMVKAGIVAAEEAMAEASRQVPLFVQITIEQTGTMLMGSEIGAALNMIEAFPSVKSFGLNCATGPVEMAPNVRFLGNHSTRPISVQPNAGLPTLEKGQAAYKLSPEELALHHVRFVNECGAALVGGCCGTTPAHIEAVAQAVGGTRHQADCHWRKSASTFVGFDFEIREPSQADAIKLVGASSLYQFQPYVQDSSFLIVGERTNANGSRAFRDILARENWEALTEIARDCESDGAHVLDVCAAFVGRDEVSDMVHLLSHYNRHITAPIMIDSTEWPVMEKALQCVAGKPILNSINFEDGDARPDRVLSLARKYGAAVVALTIDEKGMAKGCDQKIEIAERLIRKTRSYGLPDHDLFIDCLTFTLGSGEEEFRSAAIETIEAIRELKRRFPKINSVLGVSNISFGLKPAARQVLNSVFLHFAREAGLTSAIVDIGKIKPENQIDPEIWQIASDLVFDRRTFQAA